MNAPFLGLRILSQLLSKITDIHSVPTITILLALSMLQLKFYAQINVFLIPIKFLHPDSAELAAPSCVTPCFCPAGVASRPPLRAWAQEEECPGRFAAQARSTQRSNLLSLP